MYSLPVFLILEIFISLIKSSASLLLSLNTANSHITPHQPWYMGQNVLSWLSLLLYVLNHNS